MSTSDATPDDDLGDLWRAIRWVERLLKQLGEPGAEPAGCLMFWRGLRPAPARPPRPARLRALQGLFHLSGFETDLILLAAAVELDPRAGELCARAQGAADRTYPTPALAFELFAGVSDDGPSWSVLSPTAPLLRWQLLDVRTDGAALASARLRLDRRVLAFLLDLDGGGPAALPDPLARLLRRVRVGAGARRADLSDTQRAKAAELAGLLAAAPRSNAVVHLLGPNAEAKYLVLGRALRVLARRHRLPTLAYRLALEEWPADADVPAVARLWLRERRLDARAVLVLDGQELDPTDRPRQAAFDELLARLDEGGVVVVGREPRAVDGRPARLVDVDKPTPREQKQRWATLRGGAWDEAGQLVSRFNFNFPTIAALGRAGAGEPFPDLLDRCRDVTRPRVGALAERIEAKATWDDLVLPAAERRVLGQIADQVRNLSTVYDDWGVREAFGRGLGLGVLFAGESGTGKTFAAEVLASELQLDLFRIDLSAVMDKFIGETEKNLRRLFDAADEGGCVLLFDEADALFGKRAEVKDSHDRFANIQINYLLQRIESFRGLAVLTTNRKAALDVAFLRRLRYIVTFPFPSEAERRGIWRKVLPPPGESDVLDIPVALTDADYVLLGKLALTGGNIRTVALNAAFLAAARGECVTLALVRDAARTEFRKLGREVPPELRDEPLAAAAP